MPRPSLGGVEATGQAGEVTTTSGAGGQPQTTPLSSVFQEVFERLIAEGEQAKLPKSASGGGIPQETTQPRKILRHNISDEQLEIFRHTSRDGLSEAFWACVGIAGGSAPAALEALWQAFAAKTSVPLSGLSLLQVILFFGAVFVGITLLLVNRQKRTSVDVLIEQIRNQGK